MEIDFSPSEDLESLSVKISDILTQARVNATPAACLKALESTGNPYQKSIEFLSAELATSLEVIHSLEHLLLSGKSESFHIQVRDILFRFFFTHF